MVCFIVDENNELYVNIAIEKFNSVELKNNKIIINKFIEIPTEKLLEIKIQTK